MPELSSAPPATPTSSAPPQWPLTTVFTPPTNCFETSNLPTTWSDCEHGLHQPSGCLWNVPPSCFPPGASVGVGGTNPNGWTGSVRGYYYTPGVLPSGYHTVVASVVDGSTTNVQGCLSGWGNYGESWCTSKIDGFYVTKEGGIVKTSSGSFAGVMAHVRVRWVSSDLPLFTPASAPALPSSVLASYEATAKPKKTSQQPVNPTTNTAPAGAATSNGGKQPDSGLSTGAKAGIGVAVVLAVLILLGVILFVFHRKRKQNTAPNRASSNGADNNHAHLDEPIELPAQVSKAPHEVEARSFELPPILLANNSLISEAPSSEMHEMQGHFQGYEAEGARSPVEVHAGEH